ncbi:hypothetical protein [Aquabacterium sp. J223]|uniref:hypothetical protein n=1 Tax=Aquabacterium sp. J223 TaxID=2898431 RepID=UPI0021AE26A4|nr:hypothetical protein [Aquabacterium sp. J223]UUX94054.1 hypothetical protein LRS07_11920 [Aquabacterium sp. J223]
MPQRDTLLRLVEAGLAAPSAENRHALRFEAAAQTLDLVATDHAGWREQPHKAWLARLAAGAVVENIRLAAATEGLRAETRWLPDADRPEHLARLHWHPAGVAGADALAAQIAQRHTNRRFYRRERLAPDVLHSLSQALEGLPGLRLAWLDAAAARRPALAAITGAEAERFCRRRLHEELFAGVRFERGWTGSVDEGLPPAALEIEPPMRAGFALMRHWPVMRGLAAVGAHRLLAQRAARLPCALAPHLGLLVADSRSAVATLQAGRGLQRVWLAATAAGAAFQPMAAATALALQRPGDGWVSARGQQALQRRLDTLMDRLGLPDAAPVMFFRLGRAAAPSAVTGRTPAAGHLVLLDPALPRAA